MRDDRLKFIEALFDDGDRVAFGEKPISCNKPADLLPFFLNTGAEQFCINPLDTWRNTENITGIVNLLFEVDEDINGNKVDESIQEQLFLDSGIPFTTMVSSGNKSVHVILRFTEPFSDGELQERWWKSIATALKKHGIKADPRARLLTQISRVPGSIRSKTGEVQTLKHIRERVSQLEVLEWLSKNDVVIPPKKVYVARVFDTTGDDLTRWERAVRWTERKNGTYSTYMTTGAHDWLWKHGGNCYKNELGLSAAISMAHINYGTQYTGSSGTGEVAKTITLGWKWMEKKQ